MVELPGQFWSSTFRLHPLRGSLASTSWKFCDGHPHTGDVPLYPHTPMLPQYPNTWHWSATADHCSAAALLPRVALPHEPHHVAALAVVAAVRHHHGRAQRPVRQRHDAVRLHRQRRRTQRLVRRERRVVALVEVGHRRAALRPLERQVARVPVHREHVGAGRQVHAGGEVLRHHHRVRRVVERLPQDAARRVLQHQAAALLTAAADTP
ncbi:hypothetical protein EJB05_03457, partial [Eragrostis curvula]